jgi:hypothetical protein
MSDLSPKIGGSPAPAYLRSKIARTREKRGPRKTGTDPILTDSPASGPVSEPKSRNRETGDRSDVLEEGNWSGEVRKLSPIVGHSYGTLKETRAHQHQALSSLFASVYLEHFAGKAFGDRKGFGEVRCLPDYLIAGTPCGDFSDH